MKYQKYSKAPNSSVQPGNKLAAPAAYQEQQKRVWWGHEGEALVTTDHDGELRYLYTDGTYDKRSMVDHRVAFKVMVKFGEGFISEKLDEPDSVTAFRQHAIEVDLESADTTCRTANLRHLGYLSTSVAA